MQAGFSLSVSLPFLFPVLPSAHLSDGAPPLFFFFYPSVYFIFPPRGLNDGGWRLATPRSARDAPQQTDTETKHELAAGV